MYFVCIYTSLKVVSHYDLSVQSVSKKVWIGGWVELYQFFVEFFHLCKAPIVIIIIVIAGATDLSRVQWM